MTPPSERLFFVAPLPPPLHGQSHVSEALLGLLPPGRAVPLDTGGGSGPAFLPGSLRRVSRHLLAALTLLCGGRGAAYLSVNANAGMWLTAALALAARARGRRIVFHHHTAGHLSKRAAAMSALCFAGGKKAHHIVICGAMKKSIQQLYPVSGSSISKLSNIGFVDRSLLTIERKYDYSKRALTLGHLSNLTMEKGLVRALNTFRVLKAAGVSDRLVLAGPAASADVTAAINAAEIEFGADLVYLGPVAGEEKRKFFEAIDLFLFPSLYKNETQGIVNLEALSAGVPVAAFAVCCIHDDISSEIGLAIDPEANFENSVMPFALKLLSMGGEATILSRNRFHDLDDRFREELRVALRLLLGADISAAA